MKVTILAILMVMLGYFLLLYSVVAWIQDKRLCGSAPQENLDAIPDRKERFPGAHIIGWVIAVIGLVLMLGAFVWGAWDGIRSGFDLMRFLVRFLIILYVMEIYDILFFDWFLLCHSNFFPHYYPELRGIVGPHMFGYNKRTHIQHFIVYIPISIILAWICTLF